MPVDPPDKSTAALHSLQIHPDAADPALAQQQTRFNALVQEVALRRAALADWKDRVDRYDRAVGPIHRELQAAWRQWVLALDQASLQPGLTRAERAQLGELLREAAGALLQVQDDADIAAVLARHEDDAPPASQEVEHAPAQAPLLEDLAHDWERQAATAAAQRQERAAKRRAAKGAKKRAQAAQEASGSVRAVYRRLASSLHPDREPDARQRARKTALMQQANEAYAAGNLLALLELQLEAEQVDAANLAAANQQRLGHYILTLQEQLADLQAEARHLEAQFRAATGVAPGIGMQPRKADRLISSEAQRLRGELLLLRAQVRVLQDVCETKRWLRETAKPGR